MVGDNTSAPPVEFLEAPEQVRPGDRVITSGDGEVFPAGLLVGQLAQDPGGRLRVRLAADFERLEYLRVLRHLGSETIEDAGSLIQFGEGTDVIGARPTDDTASDGDNDG